MFDYVIHYADSIRDDQQIFNRYVVDFPDMAAIDVDRNFFLTGYRESQADRQMFLSPIFSLSFKCSEMVHASRVGILHSNLRKSSNLLNMYEGLNI